ncbi:GEVED domain-containing protein [Flavobacterium sedimenticola]|uniref:GEVED domain-containing protein n=1 Tax=Flavobacterium sedimenticola TaxID=3043286 RepID=A0ABT6XSF9_9FLAO|nr:GEVED domain-containing protein [Flavobacterium sedimenticola]MDI9258041.1 GEVED domain-containing protein [Flavobacterium sedimenticola]
MKNNYLTQNNSSFTKTILIISYVLLATINTTTAQTTTVYTYTGSAQTWTCPQGVTSIKVEAIGGGAGGRSSANTNGHVGGGGGGGAYARRNAITVVPGTIYTISATSIGAGGAANTAGGTTSVTINGVTVTAAGGSVGTASGTGTITGGTGGTVAASLGDAGAVFAGGNGGSGLGSGSAGGSGSGGGGGSAAGSSGAGNNGGNATTTAIPGNGGAAVASYGGAGGTGGNNTAGGNATGNYGGGGGGAGHKGNAGGSGQSGAIVITFTCPTLTTALAGADQTLTACVTSTTLTGNTPANGTGTWTVISGTATITSPNSPTSTVTGLALGTSATLRWTISNGYCGSSFDDVVITTAYGSSCLSYCAAGGNTAATSYISNVTLNTINQNSSAWNGYVNYYPTVSTNVIQSNTYTISVTIWNQTTSQKNISAWIDWNLNGVFDVATETVLSTTSTVASAQSVTLSNTFSVPGTAVVDASRLRVELAFNAEGAAAPCNTNSLTDVQDYKVNVQQILPCATPTAQPTSLILTAGGTTVLGTFTAASPAPNYYLVVVNTTGATPTPVNGTTYTVGGTIGAGNTVVDIDGNNSFTATGLTISTQYYFFVFSFNGSCTGGPLYLTASPLSGNTTTLATNYCVPTGNLNCTTNGDYIANVTLNTLNNSTTCAATGYTNFAPTGSQTTTVTRGNTYNLSVGTGIGNKKHGLAAWIDFNQNQVFDATEYFTFGNGVIANSTNTIAVLVPVGATLGTTRMRVRYGRQTNITSSSSCTMSGTYGETEDYTITIADPIVCVVPTAQPTALILNSTGTTIAGSFTAPSPAPDNYLVVINTTGAVPSPINGTNYAIGGTVGAGNTVVDNDSNVTFVASGLSTTTTYYLFVFAYNSACSGGPTYNTTSPLNGSIATITSNYCTPSVSSGQQSLGYFSEVSFVGTLNDVSNYSTYSSSPLGYQDFTNLTNLARQAQGEGINISVQALNSSFMKAWVDWNKDGDFTDTGEQVYSTGGISTYSTTFGFIIPASTPVGNYRIRIRLNSRDFTFPYDANSTDNFTSCGNINYPGETEDYLFTVVASCSAIVSTVTDGRTCGSGTVVLGASSTSAGVTQYRWYSTPTGSTLVGTSATGSWTTPSINSTTTYYVTVYNGCESLTRTAVSAVISPIPSLTYSPTNPTVCGEDFVLNLTATGDMEEVYLIDEKFSSGLGTFTNTNILSTTENTNSQWQNKTSTFVPTPVTNYNVWFPAISSGVNGNGFAFTTSDVGGVTIHNQMASATVSSSSFVNLTLSMRLFYSRYYEDGQYLTYDYVTIDVSTNGGTNWTEIKRYTEDVGIGTRFETVSFDLSGYINQTNLKVRVRYYGEWCDGLAVDDIKLYGYRPIGTALSWTSSTPVAAFTDAACTIAYVSGTPAVNVYVKPTFTQLENSMYTFTANATLANGCTTSQVITVVNNSKIWNGTDDLWDDDENWKPLGKPTSSSCIIIPDTPIDPVISGTSYDAYGKNITIKTGGALTVNTDNNITITDEVTIRTGGLLDIKNSANLIQINDAAINSGSIKMTRTTRPITRWAYVYWGSPVAENVFSQIPSQFDLKYRWQSGTSAGSWLSLASTSQGQGFITRVSNIAPFSTGTGTVDFPFIGTPGNGVVNVPVDSFDSSSMVAGNTVLLANPYPSAINAASFLTHASNTELGGTLFFWTNVTLYSGTGPYNVLDYASWNLSGGVGTAPSTDPSNTGLKPNGKIAAGQGFFAQVFADGNILFNNSMRVPDFNNQFFRISNNSSIPEDNRIWLNLYNDSTFRQMMVNYKEGATNSFDRLYDGYSFTNNEVNLYSILNNKSLVIQGRAVPFDENDIVPLGIRITYAGTYTVAIDAVDGLFSGNQSIYLRDKFLTIDHNLKESPYTFTTAAGTFDNRFELVYVTNALGIDDPTAIHTFASISNNIIKIESSENIQTVRLYDISGKLINRYLPTSATQQLSDHFNYPNGIYIAEITLENGITVKKKLMH